MQEEYDRVAGLERRRKEKLINFASINDLNKREYAEMRKQNFYAMPRNAQDIRFHRREQELIYSEVYGKLSKRVPVCAQKVLDFPHMRTHPYYVDAVWISERLGLHGLMQFKQDYNISLIYQFFATVVFDTNEERTMTWKTGHVECKSNFIEFAKILGYPYDGASVPSGVWMHSEVRESDKKKMAPMYWDKKAVGTGQGLHTLFNLLLRMFRETIAPRARNLDEIHQGTSNLLMRSLMLYRKGPDYECEGIDVMDFIFQEMWLCLLNKKTPVYATYVMALIIAKAPGERLCTINLVTHESVRPQKKISEKEKKCVPCSELEDEAAEIDELEDEDNDSSDCATMDASPQRPRMKNASNTFVPSSKEFVKQKISKMS